MANDRDGDFKYLREHSKTMSEAKHSVRVLQRDPERRFVEVEVDGKKVRVERFTEEEDREWNERLKNEKFNILSVQTGYIDFDYGSINLLDDKVSKRAWRKLSA